ncbi:uncharacterized protein UBRO_02510 [Ustilago bromivora]|uniref:Uncharacterized protein n=1 Tax=Ustilago bromivora TaxID=307758 RepID=A0A1K0G193_9BASI|nr:uncharacterized protein UBRO_02510 [Ustilago bromivora]SYW79099.1 uncharacterized protein UBRO2_02783 [Ustilago bromivora]
MANFFLLLPLVASAISLSSANSIQPYSVSWKQTQDHPSSRSGGLGSSVQGRFPAMSSEQIGLGCGVSWKNGQLHAGFDGGDKSSGVGGGFDWRPNSLSGIIGLHYNGEKINLNLTITDTKQVLFNVNGKDLDWRKVLEAELKPEGKDAGSVKRDMHHVN